MRAIGSRQFWRPVYTRSGGQPRRTSSDPARLIATFVVDDELRDRLLADATAGHKDGESLRRVRVTLEVRSQADRLEYVELAAECGADLLVIGNKGMHRRVLASVPNTVTHRAPCSVLVVKTT